MLINAKIVISMNPQPNIIMSKKKNRDDRKKLLVRYRIDEKGCVAFFDPCCDEIPAYLFGKIMEALSRVEHEWNLCIANEVSNQ